MMGEKTLMTLCLIYDDSRVLLGMKKRGFGEGRWNGYGGKINVRGGETIEQAAYREVSEELGVSVTGLRKRGIINFSFEDKPDLLPEVHLFSLNNLNEEPVETEEMRHHWFSHSEIPYDGMWPADKYWIPLILSGKNVRGSVRFKNMDTVLSHDIAEV